MSGTWLDYFRVETTALTVWGYPMSYLELVGTLLYLASVWLIARRHLLTWPVGIVSVVLYMALFYQIRLYADALEQIYYLAASIYGWWLWGRSSRRDNVVLDVGYSSRRSLLGWALVTVFCSAALGEILLRVHIWAPRVFPEAASYPRLDALTTVMSLVAMWLMARKRTESWIYWIMVDVFGIWLYAVKEVRLVAVLYGVLLVLAIRGMVDWSRAGAHLEARQAAIS